MINSQILQRKIEGGLIVHKSHRRGFDLRSVRFQVITMDKMMGIIIPRNEEPDVFQIHFQLYQEPQNKAAFLDIPDTQRGIARQGNKKLAFYHISHFSMTFRQHHLSPAATARDEVDMDKLTAALIGVVEETVQPESVSIWLIGDRLTGKPVNQSPVNQ